MNHKKMSIAQSSYGKFLLSYSIKKCKVNGKLKLILTSFFLAVKKSSTLVQFRFGYLTCADTVYEHPRGCPEAKLKFFINLPSSWTGNHM